MDAIRLFGDPNFLCQGNARRVDEDGSDSEPETNNVPPEVEITNPNAPGFQGFTPLWVMNLNLWSRDQGQILPYNGNRSFYDVSEGGSADRALPVLVRRVARNNEQGRLAINRINEVDSNAGVNTVRIRELEAANRRTQILNLTLREGLSATRTVNRELRVNQTLLENRIRDLERRLEGFISPAKRSRRQ